jgi:hypothetical protein
MYKSGPRRQAREQIEVVPLDLTPDEIEQLYNQMKEWHRQGQGEQGGALTFQEVVDHFRELLNAAAEPSEEVLNEAGRRDGTAGRRDGRTAGPMSRRSWP